MNCPLKVCEVTYCYYFFNHLYNLYAFISSGFGWYNATAQQILLSGFNSINDFVLEMERAAQEQEEEEDEEEEYSFSKILSEKPPELDEKDPKLLQSKESKVGDKEASGKPVDADEEEIEEDDLTIDHKPEVTEEGKYLLFSLCLNNADNIISSAFNAILKLSESLCLIVI